MTDLKRFINEQQARKSQERPVDWAKRRQRWLDELEQLFAGIRDSLIEAGLDRAAFTVTAHSIHEETLGAYDAPGLRVQMPAGIVEFTPVASVIIGGFGRVDVTETGRGEKVKLIAQEPDKQPGGNEGVPSHERDWVWNVYPGVGARGGFPFDDDGLVHMLKLLVGE